MTVSAVDRGEIAAAAMPDCRLTDLVLASAQTGNE